MEAFNAALFCVLTGICLTGICHAVHEKYYAVLVFYFSCCIFFITVAFYYTLKFMATLE